MTMISRNVDMEAAIIDAEARYTAANGISREKYELACQSMPGGNLRTHLYFSPFPLTLTRGEGAYVWDADGHRYSDFLGEYGAGLFGHTDPTISDALKKTLDNGIALGGPSSTEQMFSELLCNRFPSFDRVRLANSGTEANLFAIYAALLFTKRKEVMVFSGAYHGSCFRFTKGDPELNLPLPFVVAPYNNFEALGLLEDHAATLGAVIVEPILGAGGYIPADPEFLSALREACTKHGIVLIFDEVVTSRMAPGGMQELLGIVPDMTTLGKHVGGGCSFGAFGGRADIMRRFDPREADAVYHAGTFNNNQLSMTAGYTAMSQVLVPEVTAKLRKQGDDLRYRLQGVAQKHDVPIQFTGFGSVMHVHFTDKPVRSYEDVPLNTDRKKHLQHLDMLELEHYVSPRGGLLLSLPMGSAEIDGLVTAFEEFIVSRKSLIAQ